MFATIKHLFDRYNLSVGIIVPEGVEHWPRNSRAPESM